jgi:hypothetical protein
MACEWPYYIVSGHAKLPQDSPARSVYEILTVVAAVDPLSGMVMDVGSTLITGPAQEFLRRLVVGVSLDAPSDSVLETLQKYYYGGAKKALAAGIRDLYNVWSELRNGAGSNTRPGGSA